MSKAQTTMERINFQHMTDRELRAFWSRHHRGSWYRAKSLFRGRYAYMEKPVSAMWALANYAINLSAYRSCKARGDKHGMTAYRSALNLCFNDGIACGLDHADIIWSVTAK